MRLVPFRPSPRRRNVTVLATLAAYVRSVLATIPVPSSWSDTRTVVS